MKYLKNLCTLLLVAVALYGCERDSVKPPQDSRDAFVGDYTYTYIAPDSIPVYLDSTKVGSIPLEGEGEFTLILGDTVNELWMVEQGDSALATVSGNTLYLEPQTTLATYKGIEIETRYNYGLGVLTGNQIKWTVDVFMRGSYMGFTLSGSGPMDLVATKKE